MKLRLLPCLVLVLGGAFTVPNGNAGILYPSAPNGGEQAVSNALASSFLAKIDHLPPTKDLAIGRPFPVYFYPVNYTNLFSGQLLSVTKFAGWRYLLTYGTNSAELQLPYDEKKREWQEIGWQFYPALPNRYDPVLDTLRAAEQLPQAKKEDYELRYLNFLDIQFFAFWLHSKSSDIIIPVPVYGKWQDYRPYSEDETIEILKHKIDEIQPVIVPKASPSGLDFLADIPSLKAVSLKMSEAEFLDILHRQKLDYTQDVAAGQLSYWVKPKVHVIVVFGFREGRCSGIQRLPD